MPPRSRGIGRLPVWKTPFEHPSNTHQLQHRWRCANCRQTLLSPHFNPPRLQYYRAPPSYPTTPVRSFTSTSSLLKVKKGNKSTNYAERSSKSTDDGARPVPDNAAQANRNAEVDPYDYSELEAGISKALDRLKDALAKTRNAGRVSVEMLEALSVELKETATPGGSKKGEGHRVRLGDVATVVPKGGRMMLVYAQEDAHVKPLTAALVSSSHSLTPNPDPNNGLVLQVPIPPATAETRQQAAAGAKASLDRAMQDIRMARGDAQKGFRKMELGKQVIVDELRKAHKGMEEVVKKGEAEGKRLYDGALKGLER